MPDTRSIGEPLRRALIGARLRDIDVAKTLSVDPKTVQRWLGGRVPHARHRWNLADMLSLHEYDLWPHLAAIPSIDPEVYATYPHRGSVSRDTWRALFGAAETEIDILVYSGLFIAEDVELVRLFADKARTGVDVRLLLGDPTSPHIDQRGADEGIHDAMAAKIRNAIALYRPLLNTGVQIRLHSTVLYNSLYRGDREMLINQHIHGIAAAYAPVLHLHRRIDDGVFTTYLDSFNRIWKPANPLGTQ
ncbi:MAG: XRE family transcriptional regulator [Pseudonocardia sp.]